MDFTLTGVNPHGQTACGGRLVARGDVASRRRVGPHLRRSFPALDAEPIDTGDQTVPLRECRNDEIAIGIELARRRATWQARRRMRPQ